MTSVNVSPTSEAVWRFGSDLALRRRYFVEGVFAHPAKLHLGLLHRLIHLYTEPGQTILDPMAGSGSLLIAAAEERNVILRDVEPEYVRMIEASAEKVRQEAGLFAGFIDIGQADARTLTCAPVDHILFSPPYGFETGNGISNARRAALMVSDKKYGRRWKKYLEQPCHASFAAGFRYPGGQNNIGNKSGRNYWREMRLVYLRMSDILPPAGRLVLILKNFYRRGKLHDTAGGTLLLCEEIGLRLIERHARHIDRPSLWQRIRREKGLPIVEQEDVLVFGREL